LGLLSLSGVFHFFPRRFFSFSLLGLALGMFLGFNLIQGELAWILRGGGSSCHSLRALDGQRAVDVYQE